MDKSRERQIPEDFEARAFTLQGMRASDVSDGRVANRLRNRDKVIDALVALVLEGKSGTLDEVVERSGVARRSIFRHFTDLSDMMLKAFRRVVADAAPRAVLKNLGVGPLEDRIDAFVEVRLGTLQSTHPFGTVARARLAELEVLGVGLAATTEMVRVQIANQFAPELADRPAAEAERLIDAVPHGELRSLRRAGPTTRTTDRDRTGALGRCHWQPPGRPESVTRSAAPSTTPA